MLAVVVFLTACLAAVNGNINTVHLGNDQAVIFRNSFSSSSQLHRTRSHILGASCDLVLHPPQTILEWRDVFSNASTRAVEVVQLAKNVVAEYSRESGQYVLRRCDRESRYNPCPVYASGVDPNISPSRSIFWAGPHRVLLYDDLNGSYQMLFFDEDVHGSGAVFHQFEGSIFSGKFDFSGTVDFVYLTAQNSSQEFMATFHRETGAILVQTYNSTARNPTQLLGLTVATGSLAAQPGIVAKGFGDSDMILYNTHTGRFQVLRLTMSSPDTLEMVTLTHGNLTFGFGCEAITTVQECVRTPTCGWCASDGGCHQLSGRTNGRFIEFCDGKFCSVPDPQELPPSVRVPELRIQKSEASIQLAIPLSVREYMDSLENDPDPILVANQNEEHLITWASHPLESKVQKFYVPPPSIALYCMNHPHTVNCSRFETTIRAPQALKSDALQLEIVPDEQQPLQEGHSVPLSTSSDTMDASGIVGPQPLVENAKPITFQKMEIGVAPCAATHLEGNTRFEVDRVQSSEIMNAAMSNAQDPPPPLILHLHPESSIGAGISGGHTQSPTVSPTPSTSPSSSVTPSTSVSITPSPSVSPSMRSHPCPGVGVVVREELFCGRCIIFHWLPFDPVNHLTRKPDIRCQDEEEPQVLSQTAVSQANVPFEPTPEISETVLKLSWKANPPPPVPQQ